MNIFPPSGKICTVGRTKEEFESQGTGTDLWVQIGSTPKNVVRMPKKQSDLAGTNWTEGKCFVTMGKQNNSSNCNKDKQTNHDTIIM